MHTKDVFEYKTLSRLFILLWWTRAFLHSKLWLEPAYRQANNYDHQKRSTVADPLAHEAPARRAASLAREDSTFHFGLPLIRDASEPFTLHIPRLTMPDDASSTTTNTASSAANANPDMGSTYSRLASMLDGGAAPPGLKRRAPSPPQHDAPRDEVRKRARTDVCCDAEKSESVAGAVPIDGRKLVESLVEELTCGCCSAIVYRPVVVMPCQHFFCGR
jgi:hypothetical protein